MALGCGPTLSNVIGYAVGFVPAFLVAFGVNLLVLQGTLALGVNAYLAQLAGWRGVRRYGLRAQPLVCIPSATQLKHSAIMRDGCAA